MNQEEKIPGLSGEPRAPISSYLSPSDSADPKHIHPLPSNLLWPPHICGVVTISSTIWAFTPDVSLLPQILMCVSSQLLLPELFPAPALASSSVT